MIDEAPLTEEDRTLAAEYALRLLSPEDEAAFEARMLDDRRLEEAAGETVIQFSGLSHEFTPISPPPRVKNALMTDLFGAAPAPASLWERLGLWRAATFAATAAAAIMAVALVFQSGPAPVPTQPDRGALFVSEIASEDSSLRVLAVYDADTGGLQITRTAGAAFPDRVLELWAIAGSNAPVSLGVLPADEKAGITLPEALRGDVGSLVLAISDEPPGGSPTGAPTGAVLAVGEVVDI